MVKGIDRPSIENFKKEFNLKSNQGNANENHSEGSISHLSH